MKLKPNQTKCCLCNKPAVVMVEISRAFYDYNPKTDDWDYDVIGRGEELRFCKKHADKSFGRRFND